VVLLRHTIGTGRGAVAAFATGAAGTSRAALPPFLLLAVAGCGSEQSVLAPGSPEAAEVARLFWVMVAVTTPILVLVTALLLWAILPERFRRPHVTGRVFVLGGGIVLPALVLPGFTFWSYEMGVRHGPSDAAELVVEVTGHKFWWEVQYRLPGAEERVTSANELRLPVGRRVRFEVTGADVIHSFWVPALGGKIDMIPGRINVIELMPERVGVHRGQCAEFCGRQHAFMAFLAVVKPADEFDAWLARERLPAETPRSEEARRGQQAFAQAGCGTCHTVRGTEADGRLGPDLTRVGSRLTLAAGMLDNNIGNLAGWIVDAQGIKPGNRMPSFDGLDGPTVRAITRYLDGLR
jgi:cytochrome c oxidase subunit II